MCALPLKSDIDWSNFPMDIPVNGHIEVRNYRSTGDWSSPILVESPHIPVNGLASGLNYGQQCYEGLKAFRSAKNNKVLVFRPQFHARRMAQSAESVSLPFLPEDLFLDSVTKAVAANIEYIPPSDSDAYLYIRPVLFGASASLRLSPPEVTIFAVYVQPLKPYHGSAAADGLVLEDFDRAATRGMGAYKVGGNYAPVWRHAAKAGQLGYDITLHLDSETQTFVEEFSTSGFLGHYKHGDKHVLVVPDTTNAIASATSDSLVWLAREAGWIINRKRVAFSSLSSLDEVVAVGTAAAAVPICRLSRLSTREKYTFNSSEGGNLLGLASRMGDIQRGREPGPEGWCYQI